jgi:hypothetical protein
LPLFLTHLLWLHPATCLSCCAGLQTAQYSTQIFSLAVLLSSLFVYNQMGGIDEAALDRLSLVTEMTKHIRVRAGSKVWMRCRTTPHTTPILLGAALRSSSRAAAGMGPLLNGSCMVLSPADPQPTAWLPSTATAAVADLAGMPCRGC